MRPKVKRFGVFVGLAAVLWAGVTALTVLTPGMARAGAPIPGVDVIVRKHPGGTLSATNTSVFKLGPGNWSARIECSKGTACTPHFFSELRVNGKRFVLPGPTKELDLRLGDTAGPRTIEFKTCGTPCNGIGGQGGGRFTFIPTAIIAAGKSGDTLRVQNYVYNSGERVAPAPGGNDNHGGDAGNGGGDAGNAGGGAGKP